MLSNNELKNIKIIAIDNVLSQSIDWYIEKAYRYYSHHYHTPLHIAKKKINPAEVVRIYMEDILSDSNPAELLELKERLMNRPKPLLEFDSELTDDDDDEMSDEEWVMQELAKLDNTNKSQSNDETKQADASLDKKKIKEAEKEAQKLDEVLQKIKPAGDTGDIKFNIED